MVSHSLAIHSPCKWDSLTYQHIQFFVYHSFIINLVTSTSILSYLTLTCEGPLSNILLVDFNVVLSSRPMLKLPINGPSRILLEMMVIIQWLFAYVLQ